MIKPAFLFFILSFFIFQIKANDGAFSIGPQGGTIYPENNEQIEMLEEEVIYDESTGQFVTTFFFRNTSNKMQNVIIGFPVAPSDDSENDFSENPPTDHELMNEIKNTFKFETWVDGDYISRELWEIGKGNRYKFAFTTTVTFKPNQTINVVNKFNQGFGYGGDNMGGRFSSIKYILKTGAYWKGNIGKAKIIFHLNKDYHDFETKKDTGLLYMDYIGVFHKHWNASIEPVSFDFVANTITWEFMNFEPDFDIDLSFYNEVGFLLSNEFLNDIDSLSKLITTNDTTRFHELIKGFKKQYKFNDEDISYKKYFFVIYLNTAEQLLHNKGKLDSLTVHYKIRHIINAFAALHDYEFSNPLWTKTFTLFDWYTPRTKTPKYSSEITLYINRLREYESKKLYLKKETEQKDTIMVKGKNKNDYLISETVNINENKIESESYTRLVLFISAIILLIGLILYFFKKKTP